MTITQASHEAYELYAKLELNGRQTAAAAALALLLKLIGVNQ